MFQESTSIPWAAQSMSTASILLLSITGGAEISDAGLGGDEDAMADVVDSGSEEEGFAGDGGWDGAIRDCRLIGVLLDLAGRTISILLFCGTTLWSFAVPVTGVFSPRTCEICLACLLAKGGMFLSQKNQQVSWHYSSSNPPILQHSSLIQNANKILLKKVSERCWGKGRWWKACLMGGLAVFLSWGKCAIQVVDCRLYLSFCCVFSAYDTYKGVVALSLCFDMFWMFTEVHVRNFVSGNLLLYVVRA